MLVERVNAGERYDTARQIAGVELSVLDFNR